MGLTNEHNPDVKAYAVVQLRQDNALGTLYNMVGFQTKLKYGAQKEIFRLIPGLENAEFATSRRPASQHLYQLTATARSNGTIEEPPRACDSPARLPAAKAMWNRPRSGCLTGRFAAAERLGRSPSLPPETTAFGALLGHITGGHLSSNDEPGKRSFQPMNVNFGLFPPVEIVKPEGVKRFRGKDKAIWPRRRAVSGARPLRLPFEWLGIDG